MLLGCKGQFVPKIVDGTKPHSFRAKRKDGRKWKVGDTIQFYENVRQPNMRKIRLDGVVVGVQEVVMAFLHNSKNKLHMIIDGRVIHADELNEIAIKDGFCSINEFSLFFFPNQSDKKWQGQLVHWTDLKY